MRTIAAIIEKRLEAKFLDGPQYTRKTPVASDYAVFWDWCSYYQAPRTEEESQAFKQDLRKVNLWYAHESTETWMLTTPLEGVLAYEERGWPTFEAGISSMLTRAHALLDLGKHVIGDDVSWGDVWRNCRARRLAPMEPRAF